MGKKNAMLADLDGTLCDISHRIHLYHAKRYDDFHSLLVNDPVNQNVVNMLWGCISGGIEPIFLTARPERFRALTTEWLRKNVGDHMAKKPLFMKLDDDARDDDVVKQNIFVNKIQPNYNVVLAIEDRAHVVEMWRSLGLECWAVAKGEY